jgi:hypothetical protein
MQTDVPLHISSAIPIEWVEAVTEPVLSLPQPAARPIRPRRGGVCGNLPSQASSQFERVLVLYIHGPSYKQMHVELRQTISKHVNKRGRNVRNSESKQNPHSVKQIKTETPEETK